ncbi:unnamed protein product, partial [Polarella glacialis]
PTVLRHQGVSFVVVGQVPLVSLDKTSTWHPHVSGLLQAAASQHKGRAEAAYEFCDDDVGLQARCCQLGFGEVAIVRMTRPDLRHVKAAAVNRKRPRRSAGAAGLLPAAAAEKRIAAFLQRVRSSTCQGSFLQNLEQAAAIEAEKQLVSGSQKVWIANWLGKFQPHLGSQREFLERFPDKFMVVPGQGKAYRVLCLLPNCFGEEASCREVASP